MRTIIILVVSITSFFVNVEAQTFKITHLTAFGPDWSIEDVNNEQQTWLGGTVTLAFYNQTVKFSDWIDCKGVYHTNVITPLFTKVNDDYYRGFDKKGIAELRFNKFLSYITTAELNYREDQVGSITPNTYMMRLTRK